MILPNCKPVLGIGLLATAREADTRLRGMRWYRALPFAAWTFVKLVLMVTILAPIELAARREERLLKIERAIRKLEDDNRYEGPYA